MRVRAPIVVKEPGCRPDAVRAPLSQGVCFAADGCSSGLYVSELGLVDIVLAAARSDRRGSKRVLALATFVAFFVWASLQQVAQARTDGRLTKAELAASSADDSALLPPTGRARLDELARSSADASQAVHRLDATPVREVETLELQDAEDDARLGAQSVGLLAALVPMVSSARPGSTLVFAVWGAQCWVSSAFPRGPPRTTR